MHTMYDLLSSISLDTTAGEINAAALVIATGGLSIPKIGATDFGYRVAKQFGHKLIDTRPALVPLTSLLLGVGLIVQVILAPQGLGGVLEATETRLFRRLAGTAPGKAEDAVKKEDSHATV